MTKKLNTGWWFLTLKGILFIIFGVLAIVYPDTALKSVLIYLGIVILLMGIVFLVAAIRSIRNKYPWELYMLEAVVDIILGILFIAYPAFTVKVFVTLIGIWAVILGGYQLITYYRMRKAMGNNPMYIYTGLFALVLGLLFIFNPFGTGMVVTILIGIFAVIFGIMMIVISINMRKALPA
jgi:uncharacterized membrane protein HdeD (DUF308 family)